MSESESAASSASTDTRHKPVMNLVSNNNALAHYKQSRGFDQISHALPNIHGLYGCNCNVSDVISVYSLNLGKLPGHFSYEQPGYEATPTHTHITNTIHDRRKVTQTS